MKKISLSGKRGEGKFALVDDDLFIYLNKWKWGLSINGYAFRAVHKEMVNGKARHADLFMHRLINKTPKKFITDHINGDKLDNRKSNLRNATNSLNQANSKLSIRNKSGYKGVGWSPLHKKWKSSITFHQRPIFLGHFDMPVEAAIAYDAAAKELYGEYARTNF